MPPPPPAPPLAQTALKDKTPEPKSHPKSPLAAVEAMKSTPFKDSPKKRRIDVTKSPSPPVVSKPSAPPLPRSRTTRARSRSGAARESPRSASGSWEPGSPCSP